MRACLLVLLLAVASERIFAAPLPAANYQGLIEQLGARELAKREEATRRLKLIGTPALPSLKEATCLHVSAEVRRRADLVIRAVEQGEMLVFGNGSNYWLNRVAFTPDGKHAVATGGAVILYDLATGREINRTLELNFARCGLALSQGGKWFVTGHQHDTVVRMGEVQSGKEVKTFEGHTAGVYAVAFSPDEIRIVSGSNDKSLRLFDVKTGAELRRFQGITDMVRSVDFSPDGKQIVSGHYGAADSSFPVRLWDADKGNEIRSYKGHEKDVTAVLFLPDQRAILSASMDGTAILWDSRTGKEIRRLSHAGGIYGAAVSPDGRRALTAGFTDRKVRLWDLQSGKELRAFEGHIGAVLGVAFSADGRLALSSDSRCTVRLWRLPEQH
jgi:WD40 repeat protein